MPEKENLIKFVEKNTDPRNYKVSFEKIKKILNFVPDYNVDYGIEEIIKTLDFADYCNLKEAQDSIIALSYQPGKNVRYDYIQKHFPSV